MSELLRYRQLNRIKGLICIRKHIYVDRKKVNISFISQGKKFRLWVALGGRDKPVSVRAELDRLKESERLKASESNVLESEVLANTNGRASGIIAP